MTVMVDFNMLWNSLLILSNYFLGWYLSLKPEDNFLKRIPDLQDIAASWDLSTKFGSEPSRKTIGLLIVSNCVDKLGRLQESIYAILHFSYGEFPMIVINCSREG